MERRSRDGRPRVVRDAEHLPAARGALHVDIQVGGSDNINYSSWPSGLNTAGVPSGTARDLREWHTWSWLYRTNDTYTVYFDGYVVQTGTHPLDARRRDEAESTSTCGSSSTLGGVTRRSPT